MIFAQRLAAAGIVVRLQPTGELQIQGKLSPEWCTWIFENRANIAAELSIARMDKHALVALTKKLATRIAITDSNLAQQIHDRLLKSIERDIKWACDSIRTTWMAIAEDRPPELSALDYRAGLCEICSHTTKPRQLRLCTECPTICCARCWLDWADCCRRCRASWRMLSWSTGRLAAKARAFANEDFAVFNSEARNCPT